LNFFEVLLSKNGESSLYFVGSNRTYADIVLFSHIDALLSIDSDCLNNFPLLSKHYYNIKASSQIAKYLEKRPASGL
jgi:hypothetical protein